MSEKIYLVEGMKCKNCTAHVEKEIKLLEGVEAVFADHATGQVSVEGGALNDEQIKSAVEKAGYRFKGIAAN